MILGILSDTHRLKGNGFDRVLDAMEAAKVGRIFHCGDLVQEDQDAKKFRNIPVVCALVDNQADDPAFQNPPMGWVYTRPGGRVIPFEHEVAYIGHKLAWNSLSQKSIEFHHGLDELRLKNEWLRYIFSGHTHLPFLNETGLVRIINPGAITGSISGYIEYALLNTESGELTFVQLYQTEPTIEKFVVGVISDSSRISLIDPNFWGLLRDEFIQRGVKHVIHCGNLLFPDVGRPEMADFQVHYNLRQDQLLRIHELPKDIPGNWHLVRENAEADPVVTINGYRFCVQLNLGATISEQSVVQTEQLCQGFREQFHELDFVLCGFTRNCTLIGGYIPYVLNPGDVINDRNFATIELGKRIAITFGHVPFSK